MTYVATRVKFGFFSNIFPLSEFQGKNLWLQNSMSMSKASVLVIATTSPQGHIAIKGRLRTAAGYRRKAQQLHGSGKQLHSGGAPQGGGGGQGGWPPRPPNLSIGGHHPPNFRL